MAESSFPEWVVPGAKVIIVTEQRGLTADRVRVDTVARVTKTQVVLEGDHEASTRFRAASVEHDNSHARLTRREGGTWGTVAHLSSMDDPWARRKAALWRVEVRKGKVIDAYEAFRRDAAAHTARALAEATESFEEALATVNAR